MIRYWCLRIYDVHSVDIELKILKGNLYLQKVKFMKINELLFRNRNNDSIAIQQGERSLSYRDWYCKSEYIASLVNNAVDKQSKCIGLFIPNSIEYAISYFSILFSERVIIPIGTNSKPIEIISMLRYLEIDLIITSSSSQSYLIDALESYDKKITIIVCDTSEITVINENLNLIDKSDCLIQNNTDDDVVIMLHTSGTTSNPKRVMLTHTNLITNVESNIASLELTSTDVVLIALPMHFGYCNTAQFLTQVYLGGKIVILDSKMFLPKIFFQTVEKEKVSLFTGVPSMLFMLYSYNFVDNYDYSTLRYILFGGGKMPIEKLKLLIDRFSTVSFLQTYGQTECSPRVTLLSSKYYKSKIGSVGKEIPNVKVRIVNDKDEALAANQIGEIIVSGKNVMKGYYKNPELTNKVIRDGWLHTGDLGYKDEEGFLYLTGRIKNIIISGGINIYPEEVEQILLQHESVVDCYVYGIEDDLLGEIPVAKVVLKDEIQTGILREYCSKYLTKYKIPINFEVVDALEKTYNGKIKRYK